MLQSLRDYHNRSECDIYTLIFCVIYPTSNRQMWKWLALFFYLLSVDYIRRFRSTFSILTHYEMTYFTCYILLSSFQEHVLLHMNTWNKFVVLVIVVVVVVVTQFFIRMVSIEKWVSLIEKYLFFINPLQSVVAYLYSLKTSENL